MREADRDDPSPIATTIADSSDARAPLRAPEPAEPGALFPLEPGARYVIEREHARGGLGRVLVARDARLDRPVAIKVVLSEERTALRRFRREAMITARLQHPNIVPIYDVGDNDDGPYYAMRLVDGRPLDQVIAATGGLDERLALVPSILAIAEAVAYAHAQQIVHRDLKPANVLVGSYGETIVLDWGLAKDLAAGARDEAEPASRAPRDDAKTVAGSVLGTPLYMAPEQARGEPVDERADVYAIGAILYELLAGAPARSRASIDALLAGDDPGPIVPLPERQPGVPSDLAAIAHKALEDDPLRRYRHAKELADDLRRFQTGQLVSARAYSRWALLARFARRHRATLVASALLGTALAATAWIGVTRVLAQKRAALAARADTEAQRESLVMVQAQTQLDKDPTASVAWLKTLPPDAPGWAEARADATVAEARGVAAFALGPPDARVDWASWSPDGTRLALDLTGGGVLVWDLDARTSRRIAGAYGGADFLPDGRLVVATSDAGDTLELWDRELAGFRTLHAHGRWGALCGRAAVATFDVHGTGSLLDLDTGASRALPGVGVRPMNVICSADGHWLIATRQDQPPILVDLTNGTARAVGTPHDGFVAPSPDSRHAAIAGDDGRVRLLDLETAAETPLAHDIGFCEGLAFSADARHVAAISFEGQVHRIDLDQSPPRDVLLGTHTDDGWTVAFLGDDATVVSGANDGITLWAIDGTSRKLLGQAGVNGFLKASPGGRWLATSSRGNGTARVWRVGPVPPRVLEVGKGNLTELRALPGGGFVVADWEPGRISVVDPHQGVRVVATRLHTMSVHVLRGGRLLVGSQDGVHVVDPASGETRDLPGGAQELIDATVDGVALVKRDDGLHVLDVDAGTDRAVPGLGNEGLFLSADGKRMAFGTSTRLTTFDLATGVARALSDLPVAPSSTLMSGDGSLFASADGTGGVLRLVRADGGPGRALTGLSGRAVQDLFTTDGRTLVAADADRVVRAYDVATGAMRVLGETPTLARSMTISDDGELLAIGDEAGTLSIFSMAAGARGPLEVLRTSARTHVLEAVFSPDHRRVAAATKSEAWIWDLDEPDGAAETAAWLARMTTADAAETGPVSHLPAR